MLPASQLQSAANVHHLVEVLAILAHDGGDAAVKVRSTRVASRLVRITHPDRLERFDDLHAEPIRHLDVESVAVNARCGRTEIGMSKISPWR